MAAPPPDPPTALENRDSSLEKGDAEHGRRRGPSSVLSRARLLGPIKKDHADLPLLACCFVTGLVDAAVFANFQCFVGMQTGNTVILGLSTAGLPQNPFAWLTTLVSIVSFLVGAFVLFRASNYIAPRGPHTNRLWAGSLFVIQGLLVVIAAALATPAGIIPQNPGGRSRNELPPDDVIHNVLVVALLPPLGLQSGMQIAASRLLGFNELPINVLTSTYCDMMGDFKLLALNNVKRNRRAGAVVLLLAGAICSGWLMRSSGGLESVLWIAAGVKIFAGLGVWGFMPAAEVQ